MGKLSLHPAAGASIPFDSDEVSVGRDPLNDFVIPDGSVSRRHARLLRRGAGWAVVDQGSANGTFLDSHRVADAALRTGQELRFGVVAFRVEVEADPGELAATLGRESGATVISPSPLAPAPPATDATVPRQAVPPAPRAAAPPPPRAASGGSRPEPRPGGPAGPASGPAPGPARKGRGPLFWIGLGCGGCLTMVLGFCALLGGGLYFMASGAVSAVEAHVALLRDGQVAAAYAQLSGDLKERLSPEDYAALVAAHPGLHENAEVRAWPPSGSFNRVDDRARVTALLVARSGAQERLRCELRQEDGGWRITALSVEPAS
jgi:hypothetical protein